MDHSAENLDLEKFVSYVIDDFKLRIVTFRQRISYNTELKYMTVYFLVQGLFWSQGHHSHEDIFPLEKCFEERNQKGVPRVVF